MGRYIGHQCKTVPILRFHVLVHPNQTWTFSLCDIASQYFKFSFVLTSEIEVIKCGNQNKPKLNRYKSLQMHNME